MSSFARALKQTVLPIVIAGGAIAAAPNTAPPGPMPPADNQKLAHDIFRDIVEIRSVHDVGTGGVANILVKYLKANGFTDSEIHVVPETKYPKQVNVVVRLKGKGKGKPVMWICHMDVVDAKKEDWTPGLDPYKFTEKDGYYYGRGTSDMKDEDAAAAAALIRLKKEHFVPDRDLIVAFTADEEVGLEQDGPNFLVKEKRDLVDAGLVMNPDGGSGEIRNGKRLDFSVETVQKTYMTFKMETTNRGGHSSEPRPDNAIYQLANGLMKLAQYQFPYKTNATTRAYFAAIANTATGQKRADLLALSKEPVDQMAAARLAKDIPINAIVHTTCVATMLKAGVQENALPSSANATIQCRVFPGESVEQTRATLEKVAGDPGIKVTLMEPVQEAKETVPDPKVMAKVTKVVHAMWPGVLVMPVMAAGATDSIFSRAAGMPTYGVGGGWNDIDDDRMHGRDERNEKGNFYQTVEFTYRLMKELGTAG
ncbi:MAG TPA: M20/M25/M40 family metallo-hydrolase [Rhizomicrobium sp.]|jgi:acetylornithine deacetylase/succinyl-diaminopimelate desuccinylase-like protein